MINEQKYREFLNEGKKAYFVNRDETYIMLQVAEKGADDETIDRVLKEIKKLNRYNRRQRGIKTVLAGAAVVLIAMFITFKTYLSTDQPMQFGVFTLGLLVVGVGMAAKGITDMVF